jgi:hypothetical protein
MRRVSFVATLPVVLTAQLLGTACAPVEPQEINARHYLSLSRFTDPGEWSVVLDALPDDVTAIARWRRA